jgi:transcriptional regulator with PAS, ATPase and Fis domain
MESVWVKEFDASITVCDKDGIILEMNDKAIKTFEKSGGEKLIGSNLFDCHPEPSKTKLKNIIKEEKSNIYTIEKNGVKKMIIQKPWYKEGVYSGFIEMSVEIPLETPHFVRK